MLLFVPLGLNSLILLWRRPLSYRNQPIDLLCKSMDWFLYDNGLRHERVNSFHVSSLYFVSVISHTNCPYMYLSFHFLIPSFSFWMYQPKLYPSLFLHFFKLVRPLPPYHLPISVHLTFRVQCSIRCHYFWSKAFISSSLHLAIIAPYYNPATAHVFIACILFLQLKSFRIFFDALFSHLLLLHPI